MNYLQDELWIRIDSYQINDNTSAFSFSDKLAKENSWSRSFTELAINEYKRFIYLCCISSKGASPSPIIDIVWHLHLTYTTSYWKDFCPNILRRELHHFPSKGGSEEQSKHQKWYVETLESYTSTFGRLPPNQIWSIPLENDVDTVENPMQTDVYVKNDTNVLVQNSLGTPLALKLDFFILSIPFIYLFVAHHKLNPFHLTGKEFLVFYSVFGICLTALAFYKSMDFRKKYSEMIKAQIPKNLTVFDLGYLKGGSHRVIQIGILDLIENKAIHHMGKGLFQVSSVNAFNTSKKYNPISKNIDVSEKKEEISYHNFTSASQLELAEIESKLKAIENKINLRNTAFYLFYIIVIVGLIRLVQGIYNEKPVIYLIILIAIFVITAYILYKTSNKDFVFSEIVEDMYRFSHSDEITILYASTFLENYLWNGTACMTRENSYNDLNYFFDRKSKKNESSCSSCSSGGCGSSCSGGDGGGDSGGCGGCGGGD